jgi:hypothetical protein
MPYVPLDNPRLSSTVYEMIIAFFLRTDTAAFLDILKRWPESMYNVHHVITAVEDTLIKVPDDLALLESLALM